MTVRDLRAKYLEFFVSKGHMLHASGSLVPYDVTGKLDESLLFTGAGMVQFKPYFRGLAQPPSKRLTNVQKCVRTGDIESVGDPTHLTFFEMLGNFSFGDYFKAGAIEYSWEFLTSKQWLGLEPERLCSTVFEEDDEAYREWISRYAQAGMDAPSRVFRLGEETNFWPAGSFSSGPPGPCGPNAEMFYWTSDTTPPPGAGYTADDFVRDEAAGLWLEIGNDVFIQFEWKGRLRNPERPSEGYEKEALEPLPFSSVDDGRGLERTAAVLSGLTDVYRVDSIWPIVEKIEALGAGGFSYSDLEENLGTTAAIRIVADHARTAVFCIADGVLPGNSGRGYVLRRLIRRAVLKGRRVLGFEEPFFHHVFEGVLAALGEHYHELAERADLIQETLAGEERLFRRTLDQGSAILEDDLHTLLKANEGATRVLGGATAFRLYDTFGFPLEVTVEIAREAGVEVDIEGYEIALKEAQARSRGASGMDSVYAEGETLLLFTASNANAATVFVGYDQGSADSNLVQISPRFGQDGLTTGEFQVCLDETPFYPESGGQVGDKGVIRCDSFQFSVTNTWREMGLIWHDCVLDRFELGTSPLQAPISSKRPLSGLTAEQIAAICEAGTFFQTVRAEIELGRRRDVARNHTATHLLHAALRQVLGVHVTQAGSLVAPDHLRFDFTHAKAMSPEEIERVERIVNSHILEPLPVHTHSDVPIAQAKQRGAIALFGEKYGDRVRIVEVPGFSAELCGGCHVRQTSEIGIFKVLSESSAASGVRRIEAVTGAACYEWLSGQARIAKEAAAKLKTSDLLQGIERLMEQLREERKGRERAEASKLHSQHSGGDHAAGGRSMRQIGSVRFWPERFEDVDPKVVAATIDEVVASSPEVVALAAIVRDGKVSFVSKVGQAALKAGAHAGDLVGAVAKVAGGGGGGRADFATAGARDVRLVDEALAKASDLLAAQVGASLQTTE